MDRYESISHPQSTGLSKTPVRFVKNQLMKWQLASGDDRDLWDQVLPSLVIRVGDRHVRSMGMIPAEVMLGFRPYGPGLIIGLMDWEWEVVDDEQASHLSAAWRVGS